MAENVLRLVATIMSISRKDYPEDIKQMMIKKAITDIGQECELRKEKDNV